MNLPPGHEFLTPFCAPSPSYSFSPSPFTLSASLSMGASTSTATSTTTTTTTTADPAIMKFGGGVKLHAMRWKFTGKSLSTVSSEELIDTDANESSRKDVTSVSVANQAKESKEEGNEDRTVTTPEARPAGDHEKGGAEKAEVDHQGSEDNGKKQQQPSVDGKLKESRGVGVADHDDDDDEEEGRGYSPGFGDLPSSPSFRVYCLHSIDDDSDLESVGDGKEYHDAESCESPQSTDSFTPRTPGATNKRARFRRLRVLSHLLNVSSCYSSHNHSSNIHDSSLLLPTKPPS